MTIWPLMPLSKLGKVVTGSTPSTSKPEYWGGGVPFVTPSELDQSCPILTTPRTLTEAGAKEARLLPPDAILVCCIGSLGKVGIAGRDLVSNQQINSVIFDENVVYPKYGYYACSLLKPKLENMAPATTVAIVSKSKFEALEIPLPPLDEQKRIAAILDQADALRKARRRAIDRLNDLSQSIFYEMFGDDLYSNEQSNLSDWVSEFRYGTSNKSSEEGYPTLRIPNIVGGNIDLSDLKYVKVTNSEFSRLKLERGDLLFVRTNGNPSNVGRCSSIDTTIENLGFIYASYLIRARLKTPESALFIQAYLETPQGRKQLLENAKTSAGQYNINIDGLSAIQLPDVPLKSQLNFIEKIHSIQPLKQKYTSHANKLDDMFSSLQQRAFRGELGAASRTELSYNGK